MTPPKDIDSRVTELARSVSNSLNLSTSPTLNFHSPPTSFKQSGSFTDGGSGSIPGLSSISWKQLKPFDSKDIKVLLLENVNQTGVDILKRKGYQVEALKNSLPENQLIEKIK